MISPPDSPKKHRAFLASPRKHLLMITNHGIHQWQVIPGLPDTGGQNVFVNQFAQALLEFDFKITIVNRGGYAHPVTQEWHAGLRYKDQHRRILYLEDDKHKFVPKEEMVAHIPGLVDWLTNFLKAEGTNINLIISHYWDAAKIGVLYNQSRPAPVKHVWVPHSLGLIKKRNVAPNRWAGLRIDERIEIERELIQELDGIAATSSIIQQALQDDYGYPAPSLFLPPCIDPARYHPRQIADNDEIWNFLSQQSGLSPEEVRGCKIVTEISRTDSTKRKNVLIQAFAIAHRQVPNSLLVISIDQNQAELAQELKNLIIAGQIDRHTAIVGSIWDILPALYAITDIYCTPSIMEGFGMSAQEAAATRAPIVASHLVPYVVEYLLGPEVKEIWPEGSRQHPLRQGSGAVVVQADDINGFAHALTMLLSNDTLRQQMAKNAYQATIPYFTWANVVSLFLAEIGIGAE